MSFTGCTSDNTQTSNHDEMIIYTSIYPIQYIAEQLIKDKGAAISVLPPGVDAHTYEPAAKEITNIAKGDAFIYLGAGMEGFAEAARDALTSQDLLFIEIGAHKALFEQAQEDDHDHGHDHGGIDPHIWLDPLRMIEIASIMKDELSILYPEEQKFFEENFHQLEEELVALDQNFLDTISNHTNKQIIVSHAAYGYWEDRYGIEQTAISGINTGDEPSQKDLANIAKFANANDIRYILFEQSTSDRITSILQEHMHAEALFLHNLEVLTDRDLENDEDYMSLMKQNLSVLDKALSDS